MNRLHQSTPASSKSHKYLPQGRRRLTALVVDPIDPVSSARAALPPPLRFLASCSRVVYSRKSFGIRRFIFSFSS